MQARIAVSFVFTVLCFFIVLPLQAQQTTATSTCIQCHTNDGVLKTLYKPPKIDMSEGEG